MKRILKWVKRPTDHDLLDFEKQLDMVLTPVAPRMEFIDSLHYRLVNAKMPVAGQPQPQSIKTRDVVILGLASLLGSAVVLVAGVRVVVAILGALGLLQGVRGRLQKEQGSSTLTPAG